MKKITKRIIALALAVIMAGSLATSGGITSVKAAADYTVEIDVTYDQTSARDMLQYINAFRTSTTDLNNPATAWYTDRDGTNKVSVTGLSELKYDYDVEAFAMKRAAEIAISFSHTRPNELPREINSGENIAAGTRTAQSTFQLFREDNLGYDQEGHRRNMLGSGYTRIGIGHVVYQGVHYWVQILASGSVTGTVETTAASGTKTVPIEISNNQIGGLYSRNNSVSLKENSSIDLPGVALILKEQWGTTIPCTATFSLADNTYLSISNGKLISRSVPSSAAPYSTTLTASAYGKTLDFTVNIKTPYTITYNLNGGTLPSDAVTSYVAGETITLPIPTRVGYVFDGWYSKDDYTGGRIGYIYSVDAGSNKTYYAKWSPIRYSIVYNGNGGMGSMPSATCVYDTPHTLLANSFIKQDYTFDSWNTEADGSGTKYADKETVNNLSSVANDRVTLYAIWKENGQEPEEEPENQDPGNPFKDVKKTDYYRDSIVWALENKITTGTSPTTFSPTANCKRQDVVTFLWRAAGSPEPRSTAKFSDVPSNVYYSKAVLWAAENGITTGTSPTTFNPNGICTREQFVTFLWRTAKEPKPKGHNNFTDVKSNQYYTDAVTWAAENGITTGVSPTKFDTGKNCIRGQVVTFLYRYYN